MSTGRILFFGRLRDIAGDVQRDLPNGCVGLSLSELRDKLADAEPALADALRAPGVRVALNQNLVALEEDPTVLDGDEIAFLPPMSGG